MKRTAEDKAWSTWIRARAGYRCERCGQQHAPNSMGLHAAHVFTRSIKKTRQDPDNGIALCYGCHSFFHRNPLEFHDWAQKHLGKKRYDMLAMRARRLNG